MEPKRLNVTISEAASFGEPWKGRSLFMSSDANADSISEPNEISDLSRNDSPTEAPQLPDTILRVRDFGIDKLRDSAVFPIRTSL